MMGQITYLFLIFFLSSDNLFDPRHKVPDTGVNPRRAIATEFRPERDDTEKVDGLEVVVRRSHTVRNNGLEIERSTRVTLLYPINIK